MADIEKLAADLIEVQSQMAFQEDTIGALNESISFQQKEILKLQRQLALLKARQDEQMANPDEAPPAGHDERPPHY